MAFAHFGTDAIHAGQPPDPQTGALTVPISLSTTFAQASPGKHSGFEYSRSGNPTRAAYEACVAKLDNGSYGFAFASGLAATDTICALLEAGDHVVCTSDVYGGTNRYFRGVASRAGLTTSFVSTTNLGELAAALQSNTRMVWIETLSNPTLQLCDVRACCDVVHQQRGIIVVCDNTFLSPYFMRPLDLGADIVVHSTTKYMNGHSDAVGGVAVTSNEQLAQKLKYFQNAIGAVPSPFDCYLAMRGLKTLHLRMRQHERNALAVARLLESSPHVKQVIFPGLEDHPQHELCKQQAKGFSGMVTFFIKGDGDNAKRFLESLKLFSLAESLGAVESLAELPSIMTHASVPEDQRAKLGISDTLIRLSVGIEDEEDILTDIRQALEASVVSEPTPAAAASPASAPARSESGASPTTPRSDGTGAARPRHVRTMHETTFDKEEPRTPTGKKRHPPGGHTSIEL